MSKKKLYFTTTEIAPFANVTSLAKFSEKNSAIFTRKRS